MVGKIIGVIVMVLMTGVFWWVGRKVRQGRWMDYILFNMSEEERAQVDKAVLAKYNGIIAYCAAILWILLIPCVVFDLTWLINPLCGVFVVGCAIAIPIVSKRAGVLSRKRS